jgi:hypothetical protein
MSFEAPLRGTLPPVFTTPAEVWAAHLAGHIGEAEAERLDAELRQPVAPRPAPSLRPLRAIGRFAKPRRQRSPDRQRSIERRRRLAATWPAPPAMLAKLTPCEAALCRILADEHHRHGRYELCHNEAAARVGCSRETIKRSMQTLKRFGWITVKHRPIEGRKHRTNIVRITSPEWLMWLTNGPRPRSSDRPTPVGEHLRTPTENQFLHSGAARQIKVQPVRGYLRNKGSSSNGTALS